MSVIKFPHNLIIFGAKSLALGASHAIMTVHPEVHVEGFVVSSLKGNPATLNGMKVYELSEIEDKSMCILIATPQDIQTKIKEYLEEQGFYNYICMDWQLEAYLMSNYYKEEGIFAVLPVVDDKQKSFGNKNEINDTHPDVKCYMAKFYRDRKINCDYNVPDWVSPIQVGAALTDERVCDITDNTGDNISAKNVNYCELTALYWIWKNELECVKSSQEVCDYYGMYQYRRLLDVDDAQMRYIMDNDIDVVLPLPTMCEPNIFEHHERYVKAGDWDAMLQALKELCPEYMQTYDKIYKESYMYNYNILLAKREVLEDYCAWLFPILERTEELSVPKGSERADRYIGYLGENLTTLYFMHNRDKLKVYHTGRVMLV